MISHGPHVMTLANSIIGVSVLAMPFCFKQCGIILAIIVLLLCSLLSRLSCHYLIKSAVMSRRRNFEYLAFHAFGQMGKFIIELFIIGFLLGTCIAFFVVIGDLGPQIIGKLLNKNTEDIRLSFMFITAVFIILPLGMLKNIDSLAIVCTATIGFYLCLVLKVVSDSMDSIFQEDWQKNVNYWRSAGLLQCLPIFSMALFCQTQLFEIYESIPNVSLEKMNTVVRGALNICTFVYLFVGFFGYVAYSNQPFSGNILSSFEPSATSDAMKIGFVLSVMFSFPLVIFPCRASLNSLLFQQIYSHDLTSNSYYIPEWRFRYLTVAIVGAAMTTGMLMPNIEFVLGFVGSTIGVSICVICPAAFFIAISTKNTNERLLAQVLLFIGIWIMILGTYANLYAIDDSSTTKVSINAERPLIQINNGQFNQRNGENNRGFLPRVPPAVKHEVDKTIGLEKLPEPPDLVDKHLVVTQKIDEIVPPDFPAKVDDKPGENVKEENEIVEKTSEAIEILNAEEKIKAIEESMNQVPQEPKQIGDKITDDKVPAPGEEKNGKEEESEMVDKGNIRLTLERNKIETKKLIEEQKELLQKQKEFLEDLKEQKKALDMDKEDKKKIEINKENKLVGFENEEERKKINIDEEKKKLDKQNEEENGEVDKKKEKLIPHVEKIQENKLDLVNVEKIKLSNQEIKNSSDKVKEKNIDGVDNQGPILKLLTDKTAVKNISLNIEKHIETLDTVPRNLIEKKINSTIVSEKLDDKNSSKQILYPLPLALKIINETKHKESQKVEKEDNNNSLEKQSLNQRDILAVHDRDKRDVDEEELENSKGIQFETSDANLVSSIIKTNNHLTNPHIKLNSKIPKSIVNLNFGILKTRDLKALKPGKRRD